MNARVEFNRWKNRILRSEMVAPDQLLANPDNWRIHPAFQEAALEGVLDDVGWVRTVLVNEATGHVVDGHLRVALALKRNEPTVPVDYVELTIEEERAILSTLDPIAALAGTDKEKLAGLLAGFQTQQAGLQALLSDLQKSAGGGGPKAGLTDPDAVPETVAEPWVQVGDLFQLGAHKLLCGDGTVAADVQRLMHGEKAEIATMDPPYGVAVVGRSKDARDATHKSGKTLKNDALTGDGLRAFLIAMFTEACKVLKPGGAWYIAYSDKEAVAFMEAAKVLGGYKQVICWVKEHFVFGRSDYHWQHEPILYGSVPGKARTWLTDRKQSTVWQIASPTTNIEVERGKHPTVKPVGLITRMLEHHTRPGAIVFDPSAGSGTTLIACEQTERAARVIELDPAFAQQAIERWEQFTGNKAVQLNTKKGAKK